MSKRLRSPIHRFGGKGLLTRHIVPLLGDPRIYVEPFGGGASVLMAKAPSPVEVYNDLDEGLVNLFEVLRRPRWFQRFRRMVEATPYSRRQYELCRAAWRREREPVKRAWAWFVVARQSFSGRFQASWGSAVTASTRGMADTTSNWLSTIDKLPAIHERLQRVQIECQDWRVILNRYDGPETCFYCDPPYPASTRKQGEYAHELTDADHAELVARLLTIQGTAVVSTYASPIYGPLGEAGWHRYTVETACHAAGRTRATGILGDGAALAKQPRTEVIWQSPRCDAQGRLAFCLTS